MMHWMSLLLSKALSQLLLPPGVLILLAVLGLVFWRRWWGRGLVGVSLALFWLLAIEPVRDGLLSPLEERYPPLALQTEDIDDGHTAIVLLGGGVYEKAPEYNGIDQLGPFSLRRTVYAADLAIRSGLPVYATGGAPLAERSEPEGRIMKRWLIRLGVPEARVFAENEAENTWQNAANLKQRLQRQGISRVVLVTSAWHMPRAVWCFSENGLNVLPAPCDYWRDAGDYDLRSWLPRWNVLNDSVAALHEYLGIAWYHLKYGR